MSTANLHPLLLRRRSGTNVGHSDGPSWSIGLKTLSPAYESNPNSPKPLIGDGGTRSASEFCDLNIGGGRALWSMAEPSAESDRHDGGVNDNENPIDSDVVVDQRYDDDDDEMNVGAAGSGTSDAFQQAALQPEVSTLSGQPMSPITNTNPAHASSSLKNVDNEYLRRLLDAAVIPSNSGAASAQHSNHQSPTAPANDDVSDATSAYDNFLLPSTSVPPRSTNKRKSSTPQCARARATLSPDGSDMLAAAVAAQAEVEQQQPAIVALQQFAEASPGAAFALDGLMVTDMPSATAQTRLPYHQTANNSARSSAVTSSSKTSTSASIPPPANAPPPPGATVRKNYCETCEQYFSTPSNFRKHLKTLVHLTTKSRCEQQHQLQQNGGVDSPIRSLLNNKNQPPPSFSSRFSSPTRNFSVSNQQQHASAVEMLQTRAAAVRAGGRPAVNQAPNRENGGGNWSTLPSLNEYGQQNDRYFPHENHQQHQRQQLDDEDGDEIICTGASFANNNNGKNYDGESFNDSAQHQPPAPPANVMDLLKATNQLQTNVPVQQQLISTLMALAMQTVPNFAQQLTQQLTRAIAAAAAPAQDQQQTFINNRRGSAAPAENVNNNNVDVATLIQNLITSGIKSTPNQQLQREQQNFKPKSPSVLVEMQSPPSSNSSRPVKKLSVPFFSNSDSPISASPLLQLHEDDEHTNEDERPFQSPSNASNDTATLDRNGVGYVDDDEEAGANQLIIDEDYEQNAPPPKLVSTFSSPNNATTQQQLPRQRRAMPSTVTTSGGQNAPDGMESYKSPGGEIITIEEPLVLPVPVNAPAGDISNRLCSIACRRCHKPFRTRTAYREHFRVVHVQHKPFSCSMCRKYFSCKSNYEKHLKTQVHRERPDTTTSSSSLTDGQNGVESPSTLSINMSPPASVQLSGGSTTKIHHQTDVESGNAFMPASSSTTSGGMLTMLNALNNGNKRLKFHDASDHRQNSAVQQQKSFANSPSTLLAAALRYQQQHRQQHQQQQQQPSPSSCFNKWRLKPLPKQPSPPPSDALSAQQHTTRSATTTNAHHQQSQTTNNGWVMSPAGNHQTPLSLMLNSPTKQPVMTMSKIVAPLKIVSSSLTMMKNGANTTNGHHIIKPDNEDNNEDVKSKIQVARNQLAACRDRQREMQRVKRQLTDEVESMRTRHSNDVRRMRSLKGKLSWMDSYFNDLRRQLGDTAYQQIEDEVLAEQHAQNAAAEGGLRALNMSEEAAGETGKLLLRVTKNEGTTASYVDDDDNMDREVNETTAKSEQTYSRSRDGFVAV